MSSEAPLTLVEVLDGVLQYMEETMADARRSANGYPVDLEAAVKQMRDRALACQQANDAS